MRHMAGTYSNVRERSPIPQEVCQMIRQPHVNNWTLDRRDPRSGLHRCLILYSRSPSRSTTSYDAQSEKQKREASWPSRLTHFALPLQRTPNPGPATRTTVHLECCADHRCPFSYPGQAVAVGVHGSGIEAYAVVPDHQVNPIVAKGQAHGHGRM